MAFDDKILDLAAALQLCLQNALAARPNAPAETCMVYGEGFQQFLSAGLVEDRCCSGFAAVRVAGIEPRVPALGVYENCGTSVWQINLEMGVARCAPFGTEQAGPTCVQMLEVAEQVQSDMGAMVEALCCLRPLVESGSMAPTGWVPFGPEGGCTGGIMGVSVQVDACGCVS
jgi:hypothetical protein